MFQGSSANTEFEYMEIIFLVFKKDGWALYFIFFHEAEESQRLNIWVSDAKCNIANESGLFHGDFV